MGLWSSRTGVLVRRGRHQEHIGARSTQQGSSHQQAKERPHRKPTLPTPWSQTSSLQDCEKIDLFLDHKYILLWQLSRLRHMLCLICSCPQPQTITTHQNCYLSTLINVAAPTELFWFALDKSEVCLSTFSVLSWYHLWPPHLRLLMSVNNTLLLLSCGSVVFLTVNMLLLTF